MKAFKTAGWIGLALAGAIWASAAATAYAAPTKVWEAAGFLQPESVVFDAARNLIYVSNINGAPNAKNGGGFISKLRPDGSFVTINWIGGMDAPKGMVIAGNRLYVSDIDRLHEIDIERGKIVASYGAQGAQFLNDTAVDSSGRVYVSEFLGHAIYRLENGKLTLWVKDKALASPNGLMVQGEKLLVASWGIMTKGFSTKVPGHMSSISLMSKKITSLGSGKPIGNLDGLEPDGKGYLVTDWMGGKLLRVSANGEATMLLDLNMGSADLEFIAAKRLALIPMMLDGKVLAYKVK